MVGYKVDEPYQDYSGHKAARIDVYLTDHCYEATAIFLSDRNTKSLCLIMHVFKFLSLVL
jgi:hypothetical protein